MQTNYADAYRVTTNGHISPSGIFDYWGLRPVIIVSKEVIDGEAEPRLILEGEIEDGEDETA